MRKIASHRLSGKTRKQLGPSRATVGPGNSRGPLWGEFLNFSI